MSDSDTSLTHLSKKMIATRELIEMVKQKRCLWDRTCPSYRDRVQKEKSWHEIYLEFEPAYDTYSANKKNHIATLITRKWNNVRDSYVKSRKSGIRRPYVYSEHLHFLDPIYINKKKSLTEKSYIEEHTSNDNDGDADNSHNWINEVFVDIEEGEAGEHEVNDVDVENDESPAKRAKIDYASSREETDENIVTILANLIQKEEDEDRAFFKSIIPAVKKLSEASKFEFRIQVMKLINSLKLRERKVVNLKRERTSNDSDSE